MKLAFSLLAAGNAQPPTPNQIFEKAYVEVVDYVNENWGTFQAFVDGLDDSNFEPVWDFCHDKLELDDEVGIDHDSFIGCGKAFGVIFGDAHISFPYWETFFGALWEKADWDKSGKVEWREWRYTEAVLAGIYSKVTFDRNDGNNNQIMDSEELVTFGEGDFADRKVEREAIYDIWKQSQLDDDVENGDMREMSLFWMNFWNLLIDEFE